MLEPFYEWMARKGQHITKPMLYKMGWLASLMGLIFLVVLWWQESDDLLDWFWGALVLCFRPYVGWMVSRMEKLETPPE